MIRYDLKCKDGHEFEAWFSNSSDYDQQAKDGLLMCAHCGTQKVDKAIMAPNVSTSRMKDKITADQAKAVKMMNAAADKIRQEIADKCDYVGDQFAEEARAIHYGEKEERGIYGNASSEDAAALDAEGIKVSALPNALAPKPIKALN